MATLTTGIHPDFVDKERVVSLDLDDEEHQLDFKVGSTLVPYVVGMKVGTYNLIFQLLGKIDPQDEPDRNAMLHVDRYVEKNGVIVRDPDDTAWQPIILRDLPTSTWAITGNAKIIISTTGIRGVGFTYRGQGGSASIESRTLKFLLQRSS